MAHRYAEIAFTPTVRAVQEALGSRQAYARHDGPEERNGVLGPREAAFIAERDSFYMASVSETGWPYVQHRGGPPGFLHVVDEKTLAFADFAGNRQYISTGNFQTNPRVALFLMDYPNQARLKILGRVRAFEASAAPELAEELFPKGYRARVERAIVVEVAGFDWNCSQHITQRFTLAEVEALAAPLRKRVADLEARLKAAGIDPDEVS
jgi:predicted pyridoxine 5'-phosphate oxidase superfamily flavin-nucleotide-binding protein